MEQATGRLVQVLGGGVDVEFPAEDLPELYEAIVIERPGQPDMIFGSAETARRSLGALYCDGLIPMGWCADYPCGAPLNRLWSPVGENTLGAFFNVLGRTVGQ
jgi:F-type H+-transporting ATPase subunit beta